MSRGGRYQYQPLTDPRAIRLLKFLPHSTVDEIHVSLADVSLDELPDIGSVAMSYVWGSSETDKHYICCDGARIYVTKNAAQVLSCFSARLPPETALWIDSVCIDQSSLAERSHQVTLMGEIYQSVSGVAIWLGQDNEACDLALEYCNEASNVEDWDDKTPSGPDHLVRRVRETDGE